MLSTTFTYHFEENSEAFKGGSVRTENVADDERVAFRGSDIDVDYEHVDHVFLSDGHMAKFYWAQGLLTPDGEPQRLLEGLTDLAIITAACEGPWLVRSEPTIEDRVGVFVINEDGKPLFTGVGDLVEVEVTPVGEPGGRSPKRAQQLIVTFEAVYSWRASSPKACAHCHGSARKGNYGPDYGGADGGT